MFFGNACRKCWKCPTDRELRLRAKLNSGWSVHTANLFHKVESISSDEFEAIENVIQRAKDLELLEIERVGRMICRLENMNRNVARNALGGNEKKSCSMCGTEDGLFRSSFVDCFDCYKAVCEKCRVDTVTFSLGICMLCKICSENREVWKKSGGWFYGRFLTMTEEIQKECTALTSSSPGILTWEHRAPDIVRLESFEPPEENRNDNSLYKDWTMNLSTPDLNIINYDDDDDDSDTANSYIELKTFRKSYQDRKDLNLNYLSVQNAKLSASCPSLSELKEEHKLKRKLSGGRKKISASARKIMKQISNQIH